MTPNMLGWLVVLIPVALSVVAWATGSHAPRAPRMVALGAVVLQGIAVVAAWSGGVTAATTADGWRALTLDGLALPLVALTVAAGLASISASWHVVRRPGEHFALLLFIQAGVSLVFMTDNLVVFYIAWESVLLPMFLVIAGWGSSNARRAAMKFLLFTFGGGALLLMGVIVVAFSGAGVSISAIAQSGGLSTASALAFWLLAIGMLVKVPAVPLHTWLPDAHTEAPTAGSIILAGVLLKMGGYGLIRIALPFAPAAATAAGGLFVALGLVGIVWGAGTALVQTDLKRLIAYSSVAHMGFVLVAIGVRTPESITAAVVTMVSHGLVAGMLFYLVGALYERAHTRELQRFGGLGALAPRWATAFVFASLASAGLPGLSGFPGEFVTAIETYRHYSWWTVVLGVGIVLAAAYGLRAVAATVQGDAGESSAVRDLDVRETVTSALFATSIVVLGVAPWLVTVGPDAATAISVALGGGAR